MDGEPRPSYAHLIVRHLIASAAIACALVSAPVHAEDIFTEGFVTRVTASGDFDVNGMHVLMDATTSITVNFPEDSPAGARTVSTQKNALPLLFAGEPIEIVGDVVHKSTEIRARRIVISFSPVTRVSGVGIIDLLPAASAATEGRIFRADGYMMLVPATAGATFAAPLKTFNDLRTNQWVRYQGVQRPDGVVVLDQVDFSPNTINHREDNLRAKTDYDPAAIDQGDAQSGTSKFFRGKDIKRLPAWHDDAMQARVERIGNSLVPAFQKALAEDDPTRIDFRFQVIDEQKHRDSWSMPSGIILVSHQLAERLPDNSQLAAVLADSIAEVLEKQDLRTIPAARKMTAANVAGTAAGVIIPGAGIATLIANHEVGKSLVAHSRQQSGRVSLCLLHDAGYDITQAPTAWWTLAAKANGASLPKHMPDHTVFLYQDLGSTGQPDSLARRNPAKAGDTSPQS